MNPEWSKQVASLAFEGAWERLLSVLRVHPELVNAKGYAPLHQAGLQALVVDEPNASTLRNPKLLPDVDHWRVRMEFREAVRGTDVMMVLPG